MDNVIQAAGAVQPSWAGIVAGARVCGGLPKRKPDKTAGDAKGQNGDPGTLEAFRQRPQDFGGDLASDRSIQWYYRALYAHMEKGYQDYPLKKERDTLFS